MPGNWRVAWQEIEKDWKLSVVNWEELRDADWQRLSSGEVTGLFPFFFGIENDQKRKACWNLMGQLLGLHSNINAGKELLFFLVCWIAWKWDKTLLLIGWNFVNSLEFKILRPGPGWNGMPLGDMPRNLSISKVIHTWHWLRTKLNDLC